MMEFVQTHATVRIRMLPPGGTTSHTLTYSSGVSVSVTNYFRVGMTYSRSVEMVVTAYMFSSRRRFE